MERYLDFERVKQEMRTIFGQMLTEKQIDYIRRCDDDCGYGYEKLQAFQIILGNDLDWILETIDD